MINKLKNNSSKSDYATELVDNGVNTSVSF